MKSFEATIDEDVPQIGAGQFLWMHPANAAQTSGSLCSTKHSTLASSVT
jgi:hypothetical protein